MDGDVRVYRNCRIRLGTAFVVLGTVRRIKDRSGVAAHASRTSRIAGGEFLLGSCDIIATAIAASIAGLSLT